MFDNCSNFFFPVISGDIKVEIINKKGETIKQLPGTAPAHKKLLVELKIIWHCKF